MSTEMARETPAVATRTVLYVALGFLAFVAVSLVALHAYFVSSVSGSAFTRPQSFPAPQLQTDPRTDRARLEAAQKELLESYAWVDRDKGIARIPITRAMRLIVDKGLHAFDPLDQPAAGTAEPRP